MFEIDSETGIVFFNYSPDLNAEKYSITVLATSTDGSTSEIEFDIFADAPGFINSDTVFTLDANTPRYGSLYSHDEDYYQLQIEPYKHYEILLYRNPSWNGYSTDPAIEFDILDGSDNYIGSSEGGSTFLPDRYTYDNQSDYSDELYINVHEHGLALITEMYDQRAYYLEVNESNLLRPTTDNNSASNEVSEDASIGAVVGITAYAEDLDAGDSVSYTLSDDAGSLFAIDGTSGVVTLAGQLDYETSTSHMITVLASSTDGSESSSDFMIDVLDEEEGDSGVTMSPEDMAGGGDFHGGLTDDIFDGSGLAAVLRIFAGEGNDEITGGKRDDHLEGGLGDDTINGGNGNDRILGGEGNDDITGANGEDILEGGLGSDVLRGNIKTDYLYGGEGDDTLLGGNGTDYLYGDAGHDIIEGQNHSDFLWGGLGDDNLNGKFGDDVLYGEEGNDILDGANHQDELYGGSGNDTLYGRGGHDYLEGGDGNDILYGNDKNDTLLGGAGTDNAYGGKGRDELHGGDGDDRLDGGWHSDKLYGDAGNDTLIGSTGNDELYGGIGVDVLKGGAGADILNGGEGNDRLFGGDNTDIFQFDQIFNTDTIKDFTSDDTIEFRYREGIDDHSASSVSYSQVGNSTEVSWER